MLLLLLQLQQALQLQQHNVVHLCELIFLLLLLHFFSTLHTLFCGRWFFFDGHTMTWMLDWISVVRRWNVIWLYVSLALNFCSALSTFIRVFFFVFFPLFFFRVELTNNKWVYNTAPLAASTLLFFSNFFHILLLFFIVCCCCLRLQRQQELEWIAVTQ